jgi:hypothetical protein
MSFRRRLHICSLVAGQISAGSATQALDPLDVSAATTISDIICHRFVIRK